MIRKLTVFFCGAFVFFSCNNNSSTKKNDEKKDENRIIASSEKGHKDANIKYLDNVTDINELLCQGWQNEDDVEQLKDMNENSDLIIPVRSYYIFPDGSFTKNIRNEMDYGNWKYDPAQKTITFNYANVGGKDVYKIAAIAADELKLVNKQLNTSTILKFISSAKVNKDPLQDPFYIRNNRWRIMPSSAESDDAIRSRLKENLHFFILYYKDAIAQDADLVSFYGLPSCLKWYSGGISLIKQTDLSEDWIKCFYSKKDALKAYGIMDKVMDKKYIWPKDESNWIKQDLSVLEQIYNTVDSVSN